MSSSSSSRDDRNRDSGNRYNGGGVRRYSTYEIVSRPAPHRTERHLSVPSGALLTIPSNAVDSGYRSSRSTSRRRDISVDRDDRDRDRREWPIDLSSGVGGSYRENGLLTVSSRQSVGGGRSRSRSSRPEARESRSDERLSLTTSSTSRRGNGNGRTVGQFQYAPLDPDNARAIRLLFVQKDLKDGRIVCDIHHATTNDNYSAVSYTWGNADDARETVLVENEDAKLGTFQVRPNLFEFLNHARRYHAEEALWIDAICINQEDIEEKNKQVKMMSKIYSKPDEVLVWLGPRVEYVGHAMRRMKEFEKMNDMDMAVSSARDDDFWKGFKAINSASYWDRVWVIQEFVQPQNGRIIQGDRSISFETFQNTIRRFDNRIYRLALRYVVFGSRRNEHFSDYISNIHPLWQRRINQNRRRTSTPSPDDEIDANWALFSGTRFCQDIRDRVYGIMPLATHGDTLNVDYHLNPFKVLLESIWLEHNSHLDRTDILMNLANILMLTPAAICMYAQRRTSKADRLLHQNRLPLRKAEAQAMHIRAASSRTMRDEWLAVAATTANSRDDMKWHNYAVDQKLKVPKNWLSFPSKQQCPWSMFVYTRINAVYIGLKVAVDSRAVPDKKGRLDDLGSRRRDEMTEEEFFEGNRKYSLAMGVYRTACAPWPLTVYYALAEGLEEVGKGGNRAAFFLDGLQDLDFDLDGLDI